METKEIQREILKEPLAPQLSREAVTLLTELCFGTPDTLAHSCEAILIFGSGIPEYQRCCQKLFPLVQRTTGAKIAYITGGPTHGNEAESDQLLRLICPAKYPEIEFRLERVSDSTRSNVTEALKLGLSAHESVIFISKSFHAGRCALTLMKEIPRAVVRHRGYHPTAPGYAIPFLPSNWHTIPLYRNHVWGEFLRIELYGSRGDIAYPDEIKEKVARIRALTAGSA